MRIIVPVKQVPNTTDVRIDPKTGTLIREGVESIVNPEDLNAVEEGLKLREAHGGEVIVVSMGPPQAEEALREVLAMGVDEAYLLTDKALAGADTLATAYSLSRAIRSIGEFDVVICGRQAIDGDTAQVGPQLAEFLKLPQITYVSKVDIEDGNVLAERLLEDGTEVVRAKLPALLTVTKEVNRPRYPTMGGIRAAHREKEIHSWGAEDFKAEPWRIGLDGSPTWVKKTFSPPPKAPGQALKGTPKEMGQELVRRLTEKNLI
ncbi:MAG: electron transfer flavoprotein subunit beta/FixA family protein [Candidatus Eiseniibacteriota bacterium]|nr:MAG: electron transfer flavoprotein subunit beta/FixA family protein [Candidatus Eisenbacteria bacterium]